MRIEIPQDVLVRKFADSAVVLHLVTEKYYSLNESGARVWELLSAGHDVASTAAAVAQEYDAPPEVVEADVRSMLSSLQELGLVTTAE